MIVRFSAFKTNNEKTRFDREGLVWERDWSGFVCVGELWMKGRK